MSEARRRRRRGGPPLLFNLLWLRGKNYGFAAKSLSYVTGSYGVTIRLRRYTNISDPLEYHEDIVTQPPHIVFTRYKPFNFIVRGRDIFFIPSRFYYRSGLCVIGGIFTSKDIRREQGGLRLSIRRALLYPPSTRRSLGQPIAKESTGGIRYAYRLLEKTGFEVGSSEEDYKLQTVNLYKVNFDLEEPIVLAYVPLHINEDYEASIASILLVKIGPYDRLKALMLDPPGTTSTLRFLAVGFTKEELIDFLGGTSDLRDIVLDLSALKGYCGAHRRSSNRSSVGDVVCSSLRKARFEFSLEDLDSTIVMRLPRNKVVRIMPLRSTSLEDSKEVLHMMREVQVQPNIFAEIGEVAGSSTELLSIPLGGGSGGELVLEAVSGVDASLRIVSFRIDYKSPSLVLQPLYPHQFITLQVKSSKAIKFTLRDVSDDALAALFILGSLSNNRFTRISGLRNLFLHAAYSATPLTNYRPSICLGKAQDTGAGYLNFYDLGEQIAEIILCEELEHLGEKLGQKAYKRLHRRYRCGSSDSVKKDINRYLGIAAALEEADPDELVKIVSRESSISVLTRCSTIFSFVYPFVKALAQVFGPLYIESNIIACKPRDSDRSSCDVYVVEANDYGLGFVDALGSQRELVNEALKAMSAIISSCNPAKYVTEVSKTLNILKARENIRNLSECFNTFLDKIGDLGLSDVPVDFVRVAYYIYLNKCLQLGKEGYNLCTDSCIAAAQRLFESSEQAFLRRILPELYYSRIPGCWDSCLLCVHISQRSLNTGLTNHEQMLFVSKTLARILLNLALASKQHAPSGAGGH